MVQFDDRCLKRLVVIHDVDEIGSGGIVVGGVVVSSGEGMFVFGGGFGGA